MLGLEIRRCVSEGNAGGYHRVLFAPMVIAAAAGLLAEPGPLYTQLSP
jgi:hypothetical protein